MRTSFSTKIRQIQSSTYKTKQASQLSIFTQWQRTHRSFPIRSSWSHPSCTMIMQQAFQNINHFLSLRWSQISLIFKRINSIWDCLMMIQVCWWMSLRCRRRCRVRSSLGRWRLSVGMRSRWSGKRANRWRKVARLVGLVDKQTTQHITRGTRVSRRWIITKREWHQPRSSQDPREMERDMHWQHLIRKQSRILIRVRQIWCWILTLLYLIVETRWMRMLIWDRYRVRGQEVIRNRIWSSRSRKIKLRSRKMLWHHRRIFKNHQMWTCMVSLI